MMLEGSRTLGESDRIERSKDLQASLSLTGSANFTRGALSAPKAKFVEAAEVLAYPLLIRRCRLTSSPARNAPSPSPSQQNQEDAETLANRLFTRLLLGDGPALRLAIAEPAAYANVEVSDIEAWRRAVLGRDHLTVASAGPLAPDEVAREIDRIFAGLPAVGRTLGSRTRRPTRARAIRGLASKVGLELSTPLGPLGVAGLHDLALQYDKLRYSRA